MGRREQQRQRKLYRPSASMAGAAARRKGVLQAQGVSESTNDSEKQEKVKEIDSIDEFMGFPKYEGGGKAKIGWLTNLHNTVVDNEYNLAGNAAVDYYFLQDDGNGFKVTVPFEPYFLIVCRVRIMLARERNVLIFQGWCRD